MPELLILLTIVAVVVWVIRLWYRGDLRRFRLPDSKLLKNLHYFFMASLGVKIGLLLFQKNETLSDQVGNFFVEMVIPYCYGAFGSEFALVWLTATAAGVAYAVAILQRGAGAARTAKNALIVLFLLSLFTLWVEPFVSLSAAAGDALMALAKVPMKFVDVGVSLAWLVVLRCATGEIDRKVAPTAEPEPAAAPAEQRKFAPDSRGRTLRWTVAVTCVGLVLLSLVWALVRQ